MLLGANNWLPVAKSKQRFACEALGKLPVAIREFSWDRLRFIRKRPILGAIKECVNMRQ
jgi:hypothetical protein